MIWITRFGRPIWASELNSGPTITTASTLGGTAMENCMLYIIEGAYTYTEAGKIFKPQISYQWRRGAFDIVGATDRFYVCTSSDIGAAISCRRILLDGNGITTETTAATSSVVADTRVVYDVEADFGLKTLSTTGTIASGSSSLTVATGTGASFTAGDQIIIPVGSEAGAGLRGTMGVGGTWPALHYADATTRDADTGQATNTYSWTETDGSIWSFNGSTWSPYSTTDYYHAKAQPLALVATISSISGDILTLSTTAKASVTDAPVYFDNFPKLNGLAEMNGSGTGNDVNWSHVFEFGTGNYAFSEKFQPNLLRDCWFKGQGKANTKVFSPDGCVSMNIWLEQCQRVRVSDMHVQGNAKDNGFGLRRTSQTTQDRSNSFSKGVQNHLGSGNCHTDLTITDVWQHAVGCDYGNYVFAKNCDVHLTDGHQIYIQWMFLWADVSTAGGTYDCSVTSPYMVGGFEMFRCVGVQHVRPTSTNGAFSCNTAGDFAYVDVRCTVTANSQKVANFWNSPVMNINGNIGSQSGDGVDLMILGGVISNPIIIMEGYINANRQYYNALINVAPDYKKVDGTPSVEIRGSYPSNPSAGGYLEIPDYLPTLNGATDSAGARHFQADGTAWIVGIRCVGVTKYEYTGSGANQSSAITFSSQSTPKGYVINSIANSIYAGSGLTTNNISDDDYVAAGAAYDAYVAAA